MKPYEVEIFDRQFNFLYTALVDDADFTYKFDAISPVKNTVSVPKDFKPSQLSNVATAPRGWYIRIFRDNEEYQGVISGFDEKETEGEIEFQQLVKLFDLSALVGVKAILSTNIETFIKNTLVANFVSNTDTNQNITGLSASSITTTSTTTGSFDYCKEDSANTAISILNDLISLAASRYSIFTKVTLNFASKTISVTIGKNTSASKTIERDLPNVIDANLTIKKTNKEINKLEIYDNFTNTWKRYYLHPDGTYSASNTNRILPVVNEIVSYDLVTYANEKINAYYDDLDGYVQLLEGGGNLTTEETEKLRTIVELVMPRIQASAQRLDSMNYEVFKGEGLDWGEYGDIYGNTYEFTGQGWFDPTSYQISTSGLLNTYNSAIAQYNYDEYWGTYSFYYDPYTVKTGNSEGPELPWGYYYRVKLYGETAIYVKVSSNPQYGSEILAQVERPLRASEVSSILNTIKSEVTIEEKRRIATAYTAEQAALIAEETFSKNKYNNLIELTAKADDTMINPLSMEIGQVVNIIHDGVSYNSILTGKEINNGVVKLVFGTIRLELTKLLNMKGV